MTESLGWTETFPLLYLWSCLQRCLRQATSYSKLLQITWSDLMLDWCLRQSTSHRVSVVYHNYGGMVDMTKASDKSGVNKLFWNVMVWITRSKVICFFRLLSKGPATFPHSNNCLDSERNCLSCARWCTDTPYKNGKKYTTESTFWLRVTACVPAFFWTNMSFEMKTRQPASQDSWRMFARYGPGRFQAIHPKIASPH